jgi:hypothetical protein
MSETARRALRLTLAGALALTAAFTVSRYVLLSLQAAVRPVRVLVARDAIQPYGTISSGQVQAVDIPSAALPAPAVAETTELAGQLARVAIALGMPLLRAYLAPSGELRHTEDAAAVILAFVAAPDHAPVTLLAPGQRIDAWRRDRFVAGNLRVVALDRLPDGRLALAVEAVQELVPHLLGAAQADELFITFAPAVRRPTATPTPVPTRLAAPPTCSVSPTTAAQPRPTPSPTPLVAVVRPGPAHGLNVRAGPGTDYLVLDVLPAGSRLTVVGRSTDGKWMEVWCVRGDTTGWVAAELVDFPQ